MLSLATGHEVCYLTGPVAGGREGYYTGAVAAGEPPGRWYGAGADELGLGGEVDAELMEAVYTHLLDPRDQATASRSTWGQAAPLAGGHRAYRSAEQVYAALLEGEAGAGPERRAELRAQAERSARQAVVFIDATFSAPKSVTALGVAFERAANDARAAGDHLAAQAWAAHQRAVENAVLAGARASMDYLQDVAGYSRVGHHGGGAGRWIDAHSFVVAQFLQHDSRNRDPQLHVHNAILNRVRCADGTWRTLDSRAIHAHRGAAGAIGERVMEAHLAAELGIRFASRPDGHGREVVGIHQHVLDLFSSRRRAITARAEELIGAFTARFGREPSALERTRLSQQATLATRAAKQHGGESLEARLDRWEAETRAAVKGGLGQVARTVLAAAQDAGPAQTWSERDVIERALATLGESRSSWTRSDLTRSISDALPGHLALPPDEMRNLLEALTDAALQFAVRLTPQPETANLPAELHLADGRSAYSGPGTDRWTTPGQIAAEQALRAAAVERGAPALTTEQADALIGRFGESGHELAADQAAALRGILTSGARIEVLAAPAGAGKTFTVAALAEAWTATDARVVGLAPTQVAADVLTGEGFPAMNTARWLAAARRGDPAAALADGDLVVLDEAGMTSTAQLVAVHQRCAQAGAKLLLVGDPRQLTAVGPGGALADLATRAARHELTDVRRFREPWERAASLQLRDADPAAIEAYHRHGRLVDAGIREQAEAAAARAWLADTLAGRESLLLVGSNEAAARVSAQLRAELVALGRVDEAGVSLGLQGTTAGVGDLVQARRNGWELLGWRNNTQVPINRTTYRVTAVRADGGLTVAPLLPDVDGRRLGEPIQLPPGYVTQHLALGYACTVHAAQGRTVDTAHLVLGSSTPASSAYVGLTRGRYTNTAWAITRTVPEDAPVGQAATVEPTTARAVLAAILDTDRAERSALVEAEQAALAARSTLRHGDQLIEGIAFATAGRLSGELDRLAADGLLTTRERARLAADDGCAALERLLRTAELAGHDPHAVLGAAVSDRSLDGARSPAQVLHARIRDRLAGRLTPTVTSAEDLLPRDIREDWRAWLGDRAAAFDQRRRELAEQTAAKRPQWAVEALGPVPDDPVARAEWEHRAGWAAAYRELAQHDHPADPLGAAPPAGLPDKHTLWRAAHAALDLPDAGADEHAMSDGQLRARVRAYQREEAWAPRWVGDQLSATHRAAARAHTDALVWQAKSTEAIDPDQRQQLAAQATRARQQAEQLDARAADLESADDARARWYLHTLDTRHAADRARVALGARGVDLDDPAEQVTAAEWLAAHHADQANEDTHREIRDEADLADAERDRAPARHLRPVVETGLADIRDTTTPDRIDARDSAERHRVPTVDYTAAAIARAQAALAEIAARQANDAVREAEEQARREQLTSWARQDEVTREAEAAAAIDDDMTLER